MYKQAVYDELTVLSYGIYDSKLISTPISEKLQKQKK